MLLNPEEVSKNQKKQSLGGLQSQGLSIFVFLRRPQVSAGFSIKILLNTEEVSKIPKLRDPGFEDLQDFVFFFFETSSGFSTIFTLAFGFFETSSGFGKVFNKNIAKTEEVSKRIKIPEAANPTTSYFKTFRPPEALAKFLHLQGFKHSEEETLVC